MADRRLVAPLVALLAVVGLAACGGGGSSKADEPLLGGKASAEVDDPTTTTEPPTTVAADPVEQAILDGYRAGWTAFLQAMDPPNPDLPALRATSTGRALEQTRKYLGEIRGRGNALRGQMVLDPKVRSHTVDTALLWDCIDDSTTEVPVASTERGGTPTKVGWEVHMRLVGVTWVQEALFETEAACSGR